MTTKTDSFRKFRFPILLVAMIVVMVVAGLVNAAVVGLGPLSLVVGLGTAAAGLFAYTRLSRWLEQRDSVPELAREKARPGLLRGAAIGVGAFLATMLLIGMFGGWDHFSAGSFWGFVASIGMMASASVNEELLFRGVIFRFAQDRFGTWIALALSAVLFGGSHLLNSGATLWGAISIAIEAGITLGVCYVFTRSVWLPIGFHFAWNLFESGVFGTTVSGASNAADGLLNTALSGPAVLTGGSFGPEASLLAVLTCLVPAVFLIRKASRRGMVVPFRSRKTETTTRLQTQS
ncbi:CPBP family intramembrane glutamic endopeptidase [Amycolatopsis pigmentata]|uniref:CPBP family intramembrane glutamic endopeptidase n=1 Tax=Amycolatopsis pigmentata TaxID=450801 RepID=A0ABW5FSS8_9PSEU